MIKICARCGKEFDALFAREKACSLECKAEIAKVNRQFRDKPKQKAVRQKPPPKQPKTKICERCGQEFKTFMSTAKRCPKCRPIYNREYSRRRYYENKQTEATKIVE
ncbi:MAG: hypothetical protein IKP64_01035 [Selenomonadaceae bacterium]|nr:hypothetical protein [Selenomonadaceae bacterium]